MYINTFYTHSHIQNLHTHIYTPYIYAYMEHTPLNTRKQHTLSHIQTHNTHIATYLCAFESSAIVRAVLLG